MVLKASSIVSSRELSLKELELNGIQRLWLELGFNGSLFLVEIAYECYGLPIKLKEKKISKQLPI